MYVTRMRRGFVQLCKWPERDQFLESAEQIGTR